MKINKLFTVLLALFFFYSSRIVAEPFGKPIIRTCYQEVLVTEMGNYKLLDVDSISFEEIIFGTTNPLDIRGYNILRFDPNANAFVPHNSVMLSNGRGQVFLSDQNVYKIEPMIHPGAQIGNIPSFTIEFVSPDLSFRYPPRQIEGVWPPQFQQMRNNCVEFDRMVFGEPYFNLNISGLCNFSLKLKNNTMTEEQSIFYFNTVLTPIEITPSVTNEFWLGAFNEENCYKGINNGEILGRPQFSPVCFDFELEVTIHSCSEEPGSILCPDLKFFKTIMICCNCEVYNPNLGVNNP